MAALHSEILLVSSDNCTLYSWPCEEDSSPTPHPLTQSLGLAGERVSLLEAGDVRASLVTESGKVATFYDRLLRGVLKDNFVIPVLHTCCSFSRLYSCPREWGPSSN